VSERRIAMRERAIGLKQRTREDLIAGQRLEQPGWSDAELEPWADAKQQFSPNVLIMYDYDNGSSVDWQAVLGRITCPALLIVSDPDRGGIVTSENAIALKALVPHLEIAHSPEGPQHPPRPVRSLHGGCLQIPLRAWRRDGDRDGLSGFGKK